MEASPNYNALDYWTLELRNAQQQERTCRARLALACRNLKTAGISDREIGERIGYSRARVQQLRVGW